MSKMIELIYTEQRVGKGVEGDPIRMEKQLWTKDGRLIAKDDRHHDNSYATDSSFFNSEELAKQY